jgi:hypothetical protein
VPLQNTIDTFKCILRAWISVSPQTSLDVVELGKISVFASILKVKE